MALSSPMKLTSSASFSPSIRISLRLRIHQAQAKNFCHVLDIRVPQCMKVVVRQIGRRQHLLVIFAHEARLDIEAVLLRSNQTAVKVGSTHCGGILHLHGSPVLEVHH